ncbi:hypothetical protein GDO81_012088 [Engystomops pustulosus]|uniref:Uncharacterized protein n=1 Tax=Engystomops pustulosus TaxID=76066 RepID=A0AAV7BIR3_ENGPU|nr:hypothetical protein GDO81_012088 [Engystomops pustulosus]
MDCDTSLLHNNQGHGISQGQDCPLPSSLPRKFPVVGLQRIPHTIEETRAVVSCERPGHARHSAPTGGHEEEQHEGEVWSLPLHIPPLPAAPCVHPATAEPDRFWK